jgi:succinate-semialdehyde dehydrogenase/glutarate-semialdehyde dehydrogenase
MLRAAANSGRQDDGLSRPRLTGFDAVKQFILDEKCCGRPVLLGCRLCLAHRKSGQLWRGWTLGQRNSEMIALKDNDLFRQQALIGGNWRDASAKAIVDVIDPASQEVLGTIPDMGREETRAAIDAAADAFKRWKTTAHAGRAVLLERWYELMRRHEQDLALLLTLEQGKPLAESLGEIRYGASFVKWFAEEARRINGSTIPSPTVDRRILVLKEPVGVCGIITPWNFPNAMITRKVAPALAAGCTVVIKPSEFTPFSALAIGVLAERAGIPLGVINVVTGMPAEIGRELMANETVRKISFTGSTRVGALLMKGAADNIKRLSLELGGNAPFVVFDDADVDRAVEGAIASKFRNGGQTCVCCNRILVQSGIYDAFAEKLAGRVAKMKVGAGTEEGVAIGPMINGAAIEKIKRHVTDALDKGAKIISQSEAMPQGRQYARPVRARWRNDRDAPGFRRDFRAGRVALSLRNRGRGDCDRQRHAVRPCRLFLH